MTKLILLAALMVTSLALNPCTTCAQSYNIWSTCKNLQCFRYKTNQIDKTDAWKT